eukprot:jgi/Mesen1/9157/ME000059S08574
MHPQRNAMYTAWGRLFSLKMLEYIEILVCERHQVVTRLHYLCFAAAVSPLAALIAANCTAFIELLNRTRRTSLGLPSIVAKALAGDTILDTILLPSGITVLAYTNVAAASMPPDVAALLLGPDGDAVAARLFAGQIMPFYTSYGSLKGKRGKLKMLLGNSILSLTQNHDVFFDANADDDLDSSPLPPSGRRRLLQTSSLVKTVQPDIFLNEIVSIQGVDGLLVPPLSFLLSSPALSPSPPPASLPLPASLPPPPGNTSTSPPVNFFPVPGSSSPPPSLLPAANTPPPASPPPQEVVAFRPPPSGVPVAPLPRSLEAPGASPPQMGDAHLPPLRRNTPPPGNSPSSPPVNFFPAPGLISPPPLTATTGMPPAIPPPQGVVAFAPPSVSAPVPLLPPSLEAPRASIPPADALPPPPLSGNPPPPDNSSNPPPVNFFPVPGSSSFPPPPATLVPLEALQADNYTDFMHLLNSTGGSSGLASLIANALAGRAPLDTSVFPSGITVLAYTNVAAASIPPDVAALLRGPDADAIAARLFAGQIVPFYISYGNLKGKRGKLKTLLGNSITSLTQNDDVYFNANVDDDLDSSPPPPSIWRRLLQTSSLVKTVQPDVFLDGSVSIQGVDGLLVPPLSFLLPAPPLPFTPLLLCQVPFTPLLLCQVPFTPLLLCQVPFTPLLLCQVPFTPLLLCQVPFTPLLLCQVPFTPLLLCQVPFTPLLLCQVPFTPLLLSPFRFMFQVQRLLLCTLTHLSWILQRHLQEGHHCCRHPLSYNLLHRFLQGKHHRYCRPLPISQRGVPTGFTFRVLSLPSPFLLLLQAIPLHVPSAVPTAVPSSPHDSSPAPPPPYPYPSALHSPAPAPGNASPSSPPLPLLPLSPPPLPGKASPPLPPAPKLPLAPPPPPQLPIEQTAPPPRPLTELQQVTLGLQKANRSELLAALQKTGLDVVLGLQSGATLLAPSDAGLASLPDAVKALVAGPQGLAYTANLLRYHIVPRYKDFAGFLATPGLYTLPTLLGTPLLVYTANGTVYVSSGESGSSSAGGARRRLLQGTTVIGDPSSALAGGSFIAVPNVLADGVISIQGLDGALVPPMDALLNLTRAPPISIPFPPPPKPVPPATPALPPPPRTDAPKPPPPPGFPAPAPRPPPLTELQKIILSLQKANRSELLAALQKTGLDVVLGLQGGATLLAPSDPAFAGIPDGISELLAGANGLVYTANLLRYHIVPVYKDFAKLQATPGLYTLPTLLGTPVLVYAGDGKVFFSSTDSGGSSAGSKRRKLLQSTVDIPVPLPSAVLDKLPDLLADGKLSMQGLEGFLIPPMAALLNLTLAPPGMVLVPQVPFEFTAVASKGVASAAWHAGITVAITVATWHTGSTVATWHTGSTVATWHAGISVATWHAGISIATWHACISIATWHAGSTIATWHACSTVATWHAGITRCYIQHYLMTERAHPQPIVRQDSSTLSVYVQCAC